MPLCTTFTAPELKRGSFATSPAFKLDVEIVFLELINIIRFSMLALGALKKTGLLVWLDADAVITTTSGTSTASS